MDGRLIVDNKISWKINCIQYPRPNICHWLDYMWNQFLNYIRHILIGLKVKTVKSIGEELKWQRKGNGSLVSFLLSWQDCSKIFGWVIEGFEWKSLSQWEWDSVCLCLHKQKTLGWHKSLISQPETKHMLAMRAAYSVCLFLNWSHTGKQLVN
jgi:hypothetical protein